MFPCRSHPDRGPLLDATDQHRSVSGASSEGARRERRRAKKVGVWKGVTCLRHRYMGLRACLANAIRAEMDRRRRRSRAMCSWLHVGVGGEATIEVSVPAGRPLARKTRPVKGEV